MSVTPAGPARPHSALELLFAPGKDAAAAPGVLPASASESIARALAQLPAVEYEAAARKVTDSAAGILDFDVLDLLIAGWRQYHDLTAAARRTLAAPGSSELISLVSHRVTATREPSVSVLINDHLVATLRFSVSLVFDVSGLLAEVAAGRLARVHAGRCDITATLAIDGTEITTGRVRLEIPGAIPVDPPIRLLADQDYPAGESVLAGGTPSG
jgi:hypothetical protein